MTEAEWIGSEDPAVMVGYIFKTIPVHEWEKMLHLILTNVKCMTWAKRNFEHLTWPEWIDHAVSCAGDPKSKRVEHAHLLREIVGNPFRPYRWTNKEQSWQSNLSSSGKPRRMYWYLPRKWLTTTVVNIARAIRDGEVCEICNKGHIANWIRCDFCHGTGHLPPRFDDMPILADALEEAGCEEEDLLRHLRGEKRCGKCPCDCGVGWRLLRGEHVQDCWVLRLLCRGE